VQVVAVLHQLQRARDDDGRVVAQLADYAMACCVADQVFRRAVQGVTEQTHTLVAALDRVLPAKSPVSYGDLMKETGWTKSKVQKQLEPALELGLIDKTDENKQQGTLIRGKHTISDLAVLPAVESLLQPGETVTWVDPVTGHTKTIGAPSPPADIPDTPPKFGATTGETVGTPTVDTAD